jgi:hypothetical protein
MWAFDLIELDGSDMRLDPLASRKATLIEVIARAQPGLRFNEHLEGDGPIVFKHACRLGLEGIVSKRKDSRYRPGRRRTGSRARTRTRPAAKGSRRGLGSMAVRKGETFEVRDSGPYSLARLPTPCLLGLGAMPSRHDDQRRSRLKLVGTTRRAYIRRSDQ